MFEQRERLHNPRRTMTQFVIVCLSTGLVSTCLAGWQGQRKPSVTESDTLKKGKSANEQMTTSLHSETEKQEMNQTDRPDGVTDLYTHALQNLRNGDAERAAVKFEAFLNEHPDHIRSMCNLSRAYLDLERFEDAAAVINRAVLADPSDADAHLVRGRVMYMLGDTEEATTSYQESISLNDLSPFAYNNLALIYIQDGRYDEAIPLLEKAIGQKDDLPYFHNNLGIAHEAVGNFPAAEQAFEEAVRIDPDNEKVLKNLDRVQAKLENVSLKSASTSQQGGA